jgi:hypothetical protein
MRASTSGTGSCLPPPEAQGGLLVGGEAVRVEIDGGGRARVRRAAVES